MEMEIKMLLSRYGRQITITKSSTDTPIITEAFIQPLRSDNQSALYGDYADGTEQYVCIVSADIPLSTYPSTTVITAGSQNYIIKKAEGVYLSGKRIYERAVLEKAIS